MVGGDRLATTWARSKLRLSGFADVARVAAEMYRPHLATVLLNHEPRSHAQVQVLVQLSREGDERLG